MMRKTLLALCLAGALLSPFVLAQSSSTGTDPAGTDVGSASSSTAIDSGASSSTGTNGGASSSSTGTTSGSSSSTGTTTTSSSSTGSGGTSEGTATAPSIGGQTLCQKYTGILYAGQGGDTADNEKALIASVVARAVLGNNTATTAGVNVPGIVGPGSPLIKYFDGTVKYRSDAPNYIADYGKNNVTNTNPNGFGLLATKLFGFFGEGLGCTLGYPVYTGNHNMTAVHQNMAITGSEMNYFDQQVALSLLSFGADANDVNAVGVPYLSEFNRYPSLHDGTVFPTGSYGAGQQNGYPITEREICKDAATCPIAPPAYSFCEKYANILSGYVNSTSEVSLVTNVVARAVLGGSGNGVNVRGIVGAGSPLLPFFNSSIQYRTNAPNYVASYLNHSADPFNPANGNDFGTLATHLVQFFGPPLGCRDSQYPAYQGNKDMRAVHANMPITQAYFNDFVTQIGNSARSFGASESDVGLVASALNAFLKADNSNSVCNQNDCNCQPGVSKDANGVCGGTPKNGAALVSPSIAGMGVAFVSAVVALLL